MPRRRRVWRNPNIAHISYICPKPPKKHMNVTKIAGKKFAAILLWRSSALLNAMGKPAAHGGSGDVPRNLNSLIRAVLQGCFFHTIFPGLGGDLEVPRTPGADDVTARLQIKRRLNTV